MDDLDFGFGDLSERAHWQFLGYLVDRALGARGTRSAAIVANKQKKKKSTG